VEEDGMKGQTDVLNEVRSFDIIRELEFVHVTDDLLQKHRDVTDSAGKLDIEKLAEASGFEVCYSKNIISDLKEYYPEIINRHDDVEKIKRYYPHFGEIPDKRKIHGFSISGLRKIFIKNEDDFPSCKQRFAIAHELSHHIIGHNYWSQSAYFL
jgi:hypothetical protein